MHNGGLCNQDYYQIFHMIVIQESCRYTFWFLGTPKIHHGFFLRGSLPSITGCISHCCIVGGNHGVHVLITQSNEWFELLTYHCLKSASYIWVPRIKLQSWLVWLSHHLQTNLKGHHHQVMVWSLPISAPGKLLVLCMLTPDRKCFFTKM